MRVAVLLLGVLALVGCGRLGPPRAPGPMEAITYPRAYPALTPEERAATIERLRSRGQPVPASLLR